MSETTSKPTTLDDFFERARQQYVEKARAGEHDHQCERRERLHMCHCEKRKRIASGITTPPTIIHQYPLCSECLQEVYHDGDGLTCERCHVSWAGNVGEDDPGTFTDDYGNITTPTHGDVHDPEAAWGKLMRPIALAEVPHE